MDFLLLIVPRQERRIQGEVVGQYAKMAGGEFPLSARPLPCWGYPDLQQIRVSNQLVSSQVTCHLNEFLCD